MEETYNTEANPEYKSPHCKYLKPFKYENFEKTDMGINALI